MSGRCQSEPIAINQNILQQPATSKKRRLWSEVPGRMVQQPTVAASSQYLFIGSYYSNRWWSNYKLAKSTSDLRNISDTKTLPPAACLLGRIQAQAEAGALVDGASRSRFLGADNKQGAIFQELCSMSHSLAKHPLSRCCSSCSSSCFGDDIKSASYLSENSVN